MGRYDYKTAHLQKVSVCGIRCEFSDIRIDRSTVPEGKDQYEVAGDDDRGGDPVRVRLGIMVSFFGTLISDQPLPIGNNSVLCLDGDFIWL
ncbi:MAG: hypothetical protein K2K74_14265 [Lachnospiraceae bacterium]|nr:hypothetical protein [Lachnospiraceae bacterium]